jgi:hypothetical protein
VFGGGALAVNALAFPTPNHYEGTAHGTLAGGGGLYGTGGPMHLGVQCAHCHIEADGLISLDIQPSPAFTQSGNDWLYAPGQRYDFVVTLVGEHKGSGPTKNQNGIGFSFEDDGGLRMGLLASDAPGVDQANCPTTVPMTPTSTTYMVGSCDAVVSSLSSDVDQWMFSWTAPPAGSGALTMWYGAVDGDQAAEDSLGDDVIQGSMRLLEN